ncbi:hypothetical protein [Aureimonas leprariae]|uniref:Uncharacterized protein n=1 Tax=Plantimonas leprariae TaxID=2615207 RepID=A0A7V7PNX7_9HYPH|nr:hypothetical protein [Aureimonas leprariae]KAB0679616.1 hypothetical protein F6X38_12395 [Aureimonas leprariae]
MSQSETIESKLRESIVEELRRQAANDGARLKVEMRGDELVVDGTIDLDDLVMVVMGSIAGGP